MQDKTIHWKQDRIISIETRKGVFILAQMLKSPYLRFYNAFREDENWGKIDTNIFDTLFTKSIIPKSFLKLSKVTILKDATPDTNRENPKTWIQTKDGFRKVKVSLDAINEREFFISGNTPGGSLVEKDIFKSGIREHSSGVIDALLLDDIPLNANDIINNNELTGMGTFPLLNERLFLCYKLGRNVDPYKDLVFDRELSKDYNIIVEIISGGGNKEDREKILDTYYR